MEKLWVGCSEDKKVGPVSHCFIETLCNIVSLNVQRQLQIRLQKHQLNQYDLDCFHALQTSAGYGVKCEVVICDHLLKLGYHCGISVALKLGYHCGISVALKLGYHCGISVALKLGYHCGISVALKLGYHCGISVALKLGYHCGISVALKLGYHCGISVALKLC